MEPLVPLVPLAPAARSLRPAALWHALQPLHEPVESH